jgi:Uma2 family endonuclease
LNDQAIVSVHHPLRLDRRSEPQPDLALLKPRTDFYANAHPVPQDVMLIMEVAETSTELDRKIKLTLYAKADIPEVWIFDLRAKRVEAYRKPTKGKYLVVETYNEEQTISPHAFPNLKIDLSEIL